MSYRSPDQALEEPIDSILDGIKAFMLAVEARKDSGEWRSEHIKELNELRKKLFLIQIDLEDLKLTTW